MPKKEPAQNANQAMLNVTDSQPTTNNVFGAGHAKGALFGSAWMSESAMNSLGLSFGSRKAIRSGDFLGFPATAHRKSKKSKIIGSVNLPSSPWICLKSNTSFMTVLISEGTTALSRS
jgi:hypothetical protein